MVTVGFIAWFLYHEPTKLWVQRHPEVFIVSVVVMVVTLISMACCTNVRRKFPMNFIFLALFTLAQSFIMAAASAGFDADAV